MAQRKNGFMWDNGKSAQQVFGNAAKKYAAHVTDQVYRHAVTEAPSIQAVLQQVGTWDDNAAEGGDYIRAAAFRNAEENAAGVTVWYDLETYRVLHPKEDPDFDWTAKHVQGRTMTEIRAEYDEQKMAAEAYQRMTEAQVDDRVMETFQDEARFLWDVIVGMLR